MDKLAALAQLPMFERVGAEVLEPLKDYFVVKRFERGECLWREGSPAHNFTFIASGQIKVVKQRADGGETILGVFDEGDSVGQIAVFRRVKYPASAIALDDTVCLEIFRDHFFGTLQRESALLESLISGMMLRNQQLIRRVEELTSSSAEQRLAMLFSKFCDKSGRRIKLEDGTMGIELDLPLSRRDIADLINVRVETAIRLMSRWNKEGPVRTRSAGFLVDDCSLLEQIASGERDD